MKRRALSVLLVFAMILALVGSSVLTVYASPYDGEMPTGKVCSTQDTAQASIDYVLARYKNKATYTGTGQCWGYAEKVSDIIADTRKVEYYKGLRFNKTNFTKKCLGIFAGSHLRLSHKKEFDPWSGHSIVLLKVSEKKVCWTDNNYAADNQIAHYSGTLEEFLDFYGHYEYINMVSKATKYKLALSPSVTSTVSGTDGNVTLNWLRTSATVRYDVYRGYSSTGPFTRIAQTTKKNYIDSRATLGKTGYYKIKTIRKNSSTFGNVVSRSIRLARPITTVSNDNQTGKIILSWQAVPRANRYAVYYIDAKTKAYKKLATTTKLSYIDTKYTGTGRRYAVKAIYDKNVAGNSSYSYSVWAKPVKK